MKCDNCPEGALYRVADAGALPAHFCGRHLPPHLTTRAADDAFPLETALKKRRAERTRETPEPEKTENEDESK